MKTKFSIFAVILFFLLLVACGNRGEIGDSSIIDNHDIVTTFTEVPASSVSPSPEASPTETVATKEP